MSSFKDKIILRFKKTKQTLELFLFSKTSGRLNQVDIDKKLVYSLSPRKIPSKTQFKYLNKFLNSKESAILKICLVVILLNIVYLGVVFYNNYLESVPVSGGTYVEGVVGYPKTINPLYASSRDIDNDLSRLIYSRLFAYNNFGELTEDLVLSYSISDDKKEYEITIKDEVRWHNGSSLTSDDIVFTYNLIRNEKYNSPLRVELSGISVEKIDDRTVKFILPEPYAPFLEMLTFGIMPKEVWQDVSPEAISLNDFNLKPIGSGPYQFKTIVKNKTGELKEYQLEVNKEYYSQKPYIENFIFRFFTSHFEAIQSFNDNNLDGLAVLPFSNKSDLLAKEANKKFELLRPQIVGLFFNLEKENLQDKEIRKYLAQAINREALTEQVYGDSYQVAWGPILKNSFAYNPEVESINLYLPDKAKSSLDSKDLKLKLTAIDINGNKLVAENVKKYWEDAGVEIEVEIISLEQALSVIKNKEFEVLLYGQLVGGDPDVFAFWHSSQIGSQGLNISSYNNEDVDNLLVEARNLISETERAEKYFAFQNILVEDVPVIFLYSPSYTYVHNKKINNFSGSSIITSSDRFSQVSDWYIKTKKTWAR